MIYNTQHGINHALANAYLRHALVKNRMLSSKLNRLFLSGRANKIHPGLIR